MPRGNGRQCLEYDSYEIVIRIHFPKGKACCDWCEFNHSENNGTRFRCNLTGELLPYHREGVGMKCPLPINQNTAPETGEDE